MVGVYFSGTGNTRYCIEKFVHGLDLDAACIGIKHPSAAQAMAQSNFIVLASPIYEGFFRKQTERFFWEKSLYSCNHGLVQRRRHGLRRKTAEKIRR